MFNNTYFSEGERDEVEEKEMQNSLMPPNKTPAGITKMVDYSAPTQLLDPKNQILLPHDPNLQSESHQNQNIKTSSPSKNSTDISDSNSMQKPTSKKTIQIDYDAETQIISHQEFQAKQNSLQMVMNSPKATKPDFSALTEKLDTSAISEIEICMAPTQELLKNVYPKKDNKGFEVGCTKDDALFMAPTQELLDASISMTKKEPHSGKDNSDYVLGEKRKVIKETQEEEVQSDSDSEIGYKKKKCLPILESQQTQELSEDHQTLSKENKNVTIDSAVISDLGEESEESMRLHFSNCSIDVSNKSLNTSNKDGDTQLEIFLPTQKEYLLSQNNRPSNPLVQVLDVEKETQDLEEAKNTEETDSNKYRTKRFVYDLEPTQILEDKLDESTTEVPDSDPEDYSNFCEMETQPIGDLSLNPKSPIKEISSKIVPGTSKPKGDFTIPKVPEIAKPNKRTRKSKEAQSLIPIPQNKIEEPTSSRSNRSSIERSTRGKSTPIKEDTIENVEEQEISKSKKNSNAKNSVEEKTVTRKTSSKSTPKIEDNASHEPEKEVSKTDVKHLEDPSTSSRTIDNENISTCATRRSTSKKEDPALNEVEIGRPKRKTNETNFLEVQVTSPTKTSHGIVTETRATRNRPTAKKEDMVAIVEGKEKPGAKRKSNEIASNKDETKRKIAPKQEVVQNQEMEPAADVQIKRVRKPKEENVLIDLPKTGKGQKRTSSEENLMNFVEELKRSSRGNKQEPSTSKRITNNRNKPSVSADEVMEVPPGVEKKEYDDMQEEKPSSRTTRGTSALKDVETRKTNKNKPTTSTSNDLEVDGRKDALSEENPISRRTTRGMSELKEKEPRNTKCASKTKGKLATNTSNEVEEVEKEEDTIVKEIPSKRTTRGASELKEIEPGKTKVALIKNKSKLAKLSSNEVEQSKSKEVALEEAKPSRGTSELKEMVPKSTRGKSSTKEEPSTSTRSKRASSIIQEHPDGSRTLRGQSTSRENIPTSKRRTISVIKDEQDINNDKSTLQNTRKKTKLEPVLSENETPTKRSKISDQNTNDLDISQQSRHELRMKHKVVFTMLDDTNLQATVGRLGGKTVDSSQECTVLCTSKISRSLKFLVAVSMGKPIVGPDWVRASGQAHKFLDPWDFILKDNETETKLSFNLREAIQKGSTTKMFEDYIFLILVNKNFDVLKNVIEACGGQVVTKVPKTTEKTFMIVSYPEDKSKYNRYLKQKPPVTIVAAEAIFAGALLQKLLLNEHIIQ